MSESFQAESPPSPESKEHINIFKTPMVFRSMNPLDILSTELSDKILPQSTTRKRLMGEKPGYEKHDSDPEGTRKLIFFESPVRYWRYTHVDEDKLRDASLIFFKNSRSGINDNLANAEAGIVAAASRIAEQSNTENWKEGSERSQKLLSDVLEGENRSAYLALQSDFLEGSRPSWTWYSKALQKQFQTNYYYKSQSFIGVPVQNIVDKASVPTGVNHGDHGLEFVVPSLNLQEIGCVIVRVPEKLGDSVYHGKEPIKWRDFSLDLFDEDRVSQIKDGSSITVGMLAEGNFERNQFIDTQKLQLIANSLIRKQFHAVSTEELRNMTPKEANEMQKNLLLKRAQVLFPDQGFTLENVVQGFPKALERFATDHFNLPPKATATDLQIGFARKHNIPIFWSDGKPYQEAHT